jgi:hypothetical protein
MAGWVGGLAMIDRTCLSEIAQMKRQARISAAVYEAKNP